MVGETQSRQKSAKLSRECGQYHIPNYAKCSSCVSPLQMLGLIVLFTVFLGLVGILILFQEWQRRLAAAGSRDPTENLRSLEVWLAAVGQHLPSAEKVTTVLSHVASGRVQPVHEVCASWGAEEGALLEEHLFRVCTVVVNYLCKACPSRTVNCC